MLNLEDEADDAAHPETVTKICRDCRQPFEMTGEHARFFLDQGLHVPVRCEACRAQRRQHPWTP